MSHNDKIKITARVKFETPRAYLITDDDDATEHWLAKSQVLVEELDEDPTYVEITMPEWLAKEKGLI